MYISKACRFHIFGGKTVRGRTLCKLFFAVVHVVVVAVVLVDDGDDDDDREIGRAHV